MTHTHESDTALPPSHEDRDRALFNAIAEQYCRKDLQPAARSARRHRLRRTLTVVPLSGDESVLEVGCGAGFSAGYLEGLYDSYTGVDYAENLIAFAKARHEGPNVAFHAANIRDFKPDKPFDIIFMIGVLHHFDDPEIILKHTLSMLAPGGWFVANEPQSSNPVIQLMRRVRGRIDGSYSTDQIQFSPRALRSLYEQVGLEAIRIRPQGLFSTPFAEILIQPQSLLLPVALCAIGLDIALERVLGRLLIPVSWNVVAAGRKPLTPTPDLS